MDDVLSALDVHTSRWIVDKCLVGDLLYDRTVILVTHNVAMTGPLAQFVVSIGSNGRIASGPIDEALGKNEGLLAKVTSENAAIEKAEATIEEPKNEGEKASGRLVADEEIALGHVSMESRQYRIYSGSYALTESLLFASHALFFESGRCGILDYIPCGHFWCRSVQRVSSHHYSVLETSLMSLVVS